jgi:hypothetical protein
LAPVPGLAILAAGVATFYYYYNRFAVLGDPSGFTPLLWDVFEIASGAVLIVIGALAQIKCPSFGPPLSSFADSS